MNYYFYKVETHRYLINIYELILLFIHSNILGLSCQVSIWNDQVIDVQLPQQVIYTVVDTPPNFKGNTAQGANKPATLDCGAVVLVPMFIEIGEKILVSTADKKYMNRAASENSKF